jgi:hypothetical protein
MDFKRKKVNPIHLDRRYLIAILVLSLVVFLTNFYDFLCHYIDIYVFTRYVSLLVLLVIGGIIFLCAYVNIDRLWSNKHLDKDIIEVKTEKIVINTFEYKNKEIWISDILGVTRNDDVVIVTTKKHVIKLKYLLDPIDAYNNLFTIVNKM